MPTGTIIIGRYGYRGAKRELPDDTIKVVNCKKMGADRGILHHTGALLKKDDMLKLVYIASALRDVYGSKFDAAVKQVVEEVKDGRSVCCACVMGKNRSQAVALYARSKLETLGYKVDVVYLGNICATP